MRIENRGLILFDGPFIQTREESESWHLGRSESYQQLVN